jgi:hypothetical protein
LVFACPLLLAALCVPAPAPLPIETQVSFLNLSRTQYVVFGVRTHGAEEFTYTPLLAPGATQRGRFIELVGERCPGSLDLRVLLYRRVQQDVPIGLDPGERVESAPIAAGQLDDVPACALETLETYTIVNWDAPDGTARVKIAQCSNIDAALQGSGRLGASGAWEVNGVDAALASIVPQSLAEISPIAGRVTLSDGRGVPGVVVLVRTRHRSALDCLMPDDPGVSGYSEPILFATTDADGRFSIERPVGVYRLEFFSDTVAFRPGQLDIETPRQDISVLAEGL